jgi:hypothetical protein
MKKYRTQLALLLFLAIFSSSAAQLRYETEIFTNINVTHNIEYAKNITIITGAPSTDTLHCDIYQPTADTLLQRPVVIVAHTGNFLPPQINGQPTGSRNDTAIVDMCSKLAKRGFVAIAMSYRLGWNPASSTQETRASTWINAIYRGIQDARTLVRYLRDDVANNGNQYKINPNIVIMTGMGSGGYIALGVGYLDSYDEINLAKFLDGNGQPYVDTSALGDVEGKWNRSLNIGNYPNENSDVQFVMNMGGAIADSSWIEIGEPPVVSVHVPNDPFAPYDYGAVIVPTSGDFVIDVSGSKNVQRCAQRLRVNACDTMSFVDPISQYAATVNGGLKFLFPFYRPSVETAPWEYWDSAYWVQIQHPLGGNYDNYARSTNPDMSRAKELRYLDSTLAFSVTREVCCLNLNNWALLPIPEDHLSTSEVSIFPNPSFSILNIEIDRKNTNIDRIVLTDINGHEIIVANNIHAKSYQLSRKDISPGMYFLSVYARNERITKKVLFE